MKKATFLTLFILLAYGCGMNKQPTNPYAKASGIASSVKLVNMTEDTSPGSDSLVYTVDDPSGTPVDRKVTLGNAITKGHGLSDGGAYISSGVMTTASIGIADDNFLWVDGSPNSGEYARFTANGLEGRTEAEFKADFNLEIGIDVQAQLTDKASLESALSDVSDLAEADGDTFSGTHDYTSATLRIPNGTTLPATCSDGDVFQDTDATTQEQFYLCEDGVWQLQGGGGGGGSSTFVGLSDTPSAYTGHALKFLRVNSGATGLEFVEGAKETEIVAWTIYDSDTAVATGDGKQAFAVPSKLNNATLTSVMCVVEDKGVTGSTTIQVRRHRETADQYMLSTLYIIEDEYYDADGDYVIDTSNDDVQTGDRIYIDVDSVHSGTAPNGLSCTLTFQVN